MVVKFFSKKVYRDESQTYEIQKYPIKIVFQNVNRFHKNFKRSIFIECNSEVSLNFYVPYLIKRNNKSYKNGIA